MAVDRTKVAEEVVQDRPPSAGELIDRLSSFDGPPEQFLANLLAVQCYLSAADGGAILRQAQEGIAAVAVHPPLPPNATPPVWLAAAGEAVPGVLSAGQTAVRPLQPSDAMYGAPPTEFVILLPIRGSQAVRGVAAFHVECRDGAALNASRERLELTVGLLSVYEMRLTLQRRQLDLQRLRLAMETIASVNEHDRFAAAGMAACNELASRLSCDRVGLGFLKGRYVHLRAMSHTEKFNRKMKVVQDIEAAQEECLDQDVEVVYPAAPQATYVSRAAKELSTRHGPAAVVSVPLRRGGQVVGVLTAERPVDRPFTVDEVECLRLTCDLATPRLANLHEHDRWFGARAAGAARKLLAGAVGPKHTWVKVAGIALTGLLLFAIFVKGDHVAQGRFVIEAAQQRVVPAPFDGYLQEVFVEPGQNVVKGQLLATFDTRQLYIDLANRQAERTREQIKAAAALGADRADKRAEAAIAQWEVKRIEAEIAGIERKIARANIVAPLDGTVVVGDLKKHQDGFKQTGDVLFEVAPLATLRAELSIPEEDIPEVQVGQEGELATSAYPDRRMTFHVESLVPVAQVVEQRNVFKVRATLAPEAMAEHSWLRPGMEGSARIKIDRRPYGVLWTQKLVNWVRMKLWL
jgi:multidrug efflux pump subunit AcrA (membrane-fusion protein)/GAF domain-containing protein